MRKTKIICTIGPASENEETLTQMCLAGMNVARLNFSHGTHAEHERKIELVKRVRQKLVPSMLSTSNWTMPLFTVTVLPGFRSLWRFL